MRSRADIVLEAQPPPFEAITQTETLMRLQLEVLLDIRAMLEAQDSRPSVVHPVSAVPPEVK